MAIMVYVRDTQEIVWPVLWFDRALTTDEVRQLMAGEMPDDN